LHSLCTFGTYQHCLIFDVRRLPDRARSTCQFEDCRYGYGDYTYIVVSNVHLLDHVCGFATLRLWVGGCFDLTSFAGVLTSNQPRKLVKARVESFFVAARNCHVKGGPSPQMTGSGVSPVYLLSLPKQRLHSMNIDTMATPCNAFIHQAPTTSHRVTDRTRSRGSRANSQKLARDLLPDGDSMMEVL
jgi:hypothetical protein